MRKYQNKATQVSLEKEIAATNKKIEAEEAKDILSQDHAQLAWLINHKECLEHTLTGTRQLSDKEKYQSQYEIIL